MHGVFSNLTKSYFCRYESRGPQSFPSVSRRSSDYQITLRSRSTFQNMESTMWFAKHGKGMLSSVEQAFVGRDEKRAPLRKPAWEAMFLGTGNCSSKMIQGGSNNRLDVCKV